ncbi:MAG: YggS family pyridoxal phosphate-dependent enzyme [Coriobacteriaceae bacterium]|nr:YggS family pyridoxal phosphate-dependent enzyme [Coriobacteriaceae bacterium]
MTLAERWESCLAEVADCCHQNGRDLDEVTVLAVSKTVDADTIEEALACGMREFGENRTGPFTEKQERYPQARWHFIGQLQSNKARAVVGRAHLIHSLDRPSLLEALEKAAATTETVQDVLIEVNVAGEESKAGLAPQDLDAFLERVCACPHLCCRGLMTMAPRGDSARARKTFAGLRELRDKMQQLYFSDDSIMLNVLSMGMSEDYAEAIAEGSTMVRIGRRIFSEDFEG